MAESRTRKVCISFVGYNQEVARKSILNQLAHYFGGGRDPKIHCELVFPADDVSSDELNGHSCSICYKDQVFWFRKRFSGKYWSFRSIDVTEAKYDAMQQFCRIHEGEGFNYMGYYANATPSWLANKFKWYTHNNKKTWYCSEIVVAALKVGGILPEDQCLSIHPEELYHILFENTYADCQRVGGAKNVRL